MQSCSSVAFFEVRKRKDLYLWLSKAPEGPSVKFHVQNGEKDRKGPAQAKKEEGRSNHTFRKVRGAWGGGNSEGGKISGNLPRVPEGGSLVKLHVQKDERG